MKLSKEEEKYFKGKKLLFAARACESKNYSGMISWYGPLKEIFFNIISFDPQKQSYIEGQKEMNSHFLNLIKKEKPDFIILWQHHDDFYIDTLFKIKEISPKTKIINFSWDDDTQFESLSRYFSIFSDFILVGQVEYLNRYKQKGIKNIFFTSCLDNNLFKPLDLKKKYDVTFIGTPKADRYKLIKFLKEKGINIRVFGIGWENYEDLVEIYSGQLDNHEMIKIFNESKINICFSKNSLGKLNLKGRIFEIGACSSFALSEKYNSLGKIFKENKEIVFFENKEDLLRKVKYYLSHEVERENIAGAMHKKIELKYNLYSELSRLFKEAYKQRHQSPVFPPKIIERVITLNEEDINNDKNFILNKVKDYDYVTFQKGEIINFNYRNYIQIHSIKTSKKPISFSSYYSYSDKLGDYLWVLPICSYYNATIKEIQSILNINGFLVDKKYFSKNILKFKKLYKKENASFITGNNTSFVSIPLLRIRGISSNPDLLGKIVFSKIDATLSSAFYKNRLFDRIYFDFLSESIFSGKFFLLKELFRTRFKENSFHTLSNTKNLIKGTLYYNHKS